MSKVKRYCPGWSWWQRTGERLKLGLGLSEVLAGAEQGSCGEGLKAFRVGLGSGRGVTEAMRESGMRLPLEAWSLLDAGEQAGRLGEAMQEVGQFLKERRARRRAFLGQIWYPLLLLWVGGLVMGIILYWVVPQLREMASGMGSGEDLPWITENLGRLYGGCFAGGVGACLGVAGLVGGLEVLARRRTGAGRLRELIYGQVPILGSVFQQTREARILKQAGTLLTGGKTLPGALEQVAAGTPVLWEREALARFREGLLLGAGFRRALGGCPLIGEESRLLLEAGQESGLLEDYMIRLARDLEEAASWRMGELTRLLEPVFLLALSGATGGLILAYLLPMVRLLEGAGSF